MTAAIVASLMLASFALTWFLIFALLRRGIWHRLLDRPNERSLHERPTPRGGGIAIVASLLVLGAVSCFLLGVELQVPVIGVCVVVIALVSFADDLSHVNAGARIVVHFVTAGVLVFAGMRLGALDLPGTSLHMPVPVGSVATAMFVVWLINLYNFMDGMDGFAGGMAVIGFATLALLGMLGGDTLFACIAAVIAAAAGGFLVFNFPPARIFMGDVGSSTLGLLVAAMALWADTSGLFPLWVSVLVFSPFIVDATFTLLGRLARGERVWMAHRSHCYQRLVRLGWGHRRTVLWEYALMVACAGSALLAVHLDAASQWWLLSLWTIIYAILLAYVRLLETRQGSGEKLQSVRSPAQH